MKYKDMKIMVNLLDKEWDLGEKAVELVVNFVPGFI